MAADRPQDPESNDAEAEEIDEEDEDRHSFLREIPVLVLLALVVALFIKTFLVQAFFIPSSSMEPTLMPGDRVLVNKLAYRFGDLHRGDVVVFQNPNEAALPDRNAVEALFHWLGEGLGLQQPENEDLIKRVIGLPGDTIAIRDHAVVVNDDPITEPYLTREALGSMSDYGPVTVPRGELFVLGDNRGNSSDSRVIGFVPEGNVVGRAFVIIWPPGDTGGLTSG
ncbi:MAG TPA: signal peptidase I [Actinomycetota bacterium]|nr:signal peptidase I [Actinomycetota bacterium]